MRTILQDSCAFHSCGWLEFKLQWDGSNLGLDPSPANKTKQVSELEKHNVFIPRNKKYHHGDKSFDSGHFVLFVGSNLVNKPYFLLIFRSSQLRKLQYIGFHVASFIHYFQVSVITFTKEMLYESNLVGVNSLRLDLDSFDKVFESSSSLTWLLFCYRTE